MVEQTFLGASSCSRRPTSDPRSCAARSRARRARTERAIAVLRGGRPRRDCSTRRDAQRAPLARTRGDWPRRSVGRLDRAAQRSSRVANRSMSRELPLTMMRSWFEITVSAVA